MVANDRLRRQPGNLCSVRGGIGEPSGQHSMRRCASRRGERFARSPGRCIWSRRRGSGCCWTAVSSRDSAPTRARSTGASWGRGRPTRGSSSGPISIGWKTFVDYAVDVGGSLAHHGFKRILYLNGHGSNQSICDLAARKCVLATGCICAATTINAAVSPALVADVLDARRRGGPGSAAACGDSAAGGRRARGASADGVSHRAAARSRSRAQPRGRSRTGPRRP